MCSRLKGQLGLGLVAQPDGDAAHGAGTARVERARSPRTTRAHDGAVARSPAAGWRQGATSELTEATGRAPGNAVGGGVHPSGGVTERRWRMLRATAFIGGEGAPVAGGDGGTTL
jgi:hypothetical protein